MVFASLFSGIEERIHADTHTHTRWKYYEPSGNVHFICPLLTRPLRLKNKTITLLDYALRYSRTRIEHHYMFTFMTIRAHSDTYLFACHTTSTSGITATNFSKWFLSHSLYLPIHWLRFSFSVAVSFSSQLNFSFFGADAAAAAIAVVAVLPLPLILSLCSSLHSTKILASLLLSLFRSLQVRNSTGFVLGKLLHISDDDCNISCTELQRKLVSE